MKKIIISICVLFFTACTDINYREEKKIVIRKPKVKEKVEEVPANEVVKLVLSGGANFEYDRWEIREEDRKKLDEFSEYLQDKSGKLIISGHTDSRGSESYNEKLSLKRAEEVKDYLGKRIELGNYDVVIEGKGEKDPIRYEKTSEAMAANRRVEILFTED